MRIIALAALTVSAYGATYYVSGTGSDSNSGLSEGAAFRTIQAAANKTLPGDVVYVPPNTISQHFNLDESKPARIAVITNRIYRKSGLNDLEQLETAPEYDPEEKLTAEKLKRYLQAKASR